MTLQNEAVLDALPVVLAELNSVGETYSVRFAPHTAFDDPAKPADAPPRESIELPTLVFHA